MFLQVNRYNIPLEENKLHCKDVSKVYINFVSFSTENWGGGVGASGASETAGLRTVRCAITLLPLILDSITASGETAVSSAGIWCKVGVGRSVITLLISFDDCIATFGSDLEEFNRSSISCLKTSCVVGESSSELSQLAG